MSLKLNNRAQKIVKELLVAKTYVSVARLAKKAGVSEKTIRNDLLDINSGLRNLKLGKIVKKRRKGVVLEIAPVESAQLERMLEQIDQISQSDRMEERRLFIIRKLLFNDRTNLSMQDIAEALYTSRSSVMKWMKEVEDWFGQFEMTIDRRKYYGIKLQGTEMNWRKAVEAFYWLGHGQQDNGGHLPDAPDFFNETEKARALDIIQELVSDSPLEFNAVVRLVEGLESAGGIRYTYYGYLRMVLHLALAVARQSQKKWVGFTAKQRRELQATREYRLALELAGQLEAVAQIRLPEDEIYYLTLYQVVEDIAAVGNEDARAEIVRDSGAFSRFLEELAQFTGKTLGVNLKPDETFYKGLLFHVRSTVFRLKFAIRFSNPFLAQIKASYPTMYGLAWGASFLFEKHFGVEVNEDEIGFLTLYISAAAERNPEKVFAVVVCDHGIGISQLITESLRRIISDLEIVTVTSAQDYAKLDKSGFDFVIATIPMLPDTKPVVTVHSILTEGDLERIKAQIVQCRKSHVHSRTALDNPVPLALYSEDLVFVEVDAQSKQEVIEFLVRQLKRKGKVSPEFIKSVLERENATSTAVGQGIAIPHGSAGEVREAAIAVARLKKPLDWSREEQVDLVFLLAFNGAQGIQKMSRFYRWFAELLDEPALLAALRSCRNSRAIYQFLTTSLNGEENQS